MFKRKKIISSLLVLVGFLLLSACGDSNSTSSSIISKGESVNSKENLDKEN